MRRETEEERKVTGTGREGSCGHNDSMMTDYGREQRLEGRRGKK